MSTIERYAVWYSVSTDRQAILNNFTTAEGQSTCQFERDFQLEGRYIDEQHAVMLWYGDAEGELGEVRRASNHSLDPGFDRLTEAVEQRLTELEITRISYLLAIPELEYSENVTHNHTLHFAGHVQYESALSDWMQDLLDEL